MFYRMHVPPVTQPTVSEHWRKLKTLSPASGQDSFFLHPSLDSVWKVVPLMLCHYHNDNDDGNYNGPGITAVLSVVRVCMRVYGCVCVRVQRRWPWSSLVTCTGVCWLRRITRRWTCPRWGCCSSPTEQIHVSCTWLFHNVWVVCSQIYSLVTTGHVWMVVSQRCISHFHFYENLAAANLGMRLALWSYEQLREIASKELFRYDSLNSAHKDGDVNVVVVVNIL